jgi:hypothetical protein
MPVFSVNFAFFNFVAQDHCARCRRALPRAVSPCGARAARETAFFPPKTRKFACRFYRNAYYDRMKRANARRAVKCTGDRSEKIESFQMRQRKSAFAVGLSWLTSRKDFR